MVSEYIIHNSDGDLNDCIEGFIECRSVRFLIIQNEFPMPSHHNKLRISRIIDIEVS